MYLMIILYWIFAVLCWFRITCNVFHQLALSDVNLAVDGGAACAVVTFWLAGSLCKALADYLEAR